jgi:hypothetical protein
VSRRFKQVSVLVVAACAVLAGCASKVDLAKVTYTRTTVPAAERDSDDPNTSESNSTGTPKANDPAFTAEKLRLLDACALMDKNTLSGVGTPDENDVTDFSRCSNFMKDPAGKDLNISLTVGESLLEDPDKADKNIGGLPAIVSELDDKTACFVTAVTETDPKRGIRFQIGGKADNMCDVGTKLLDAVIRRIRSDAPKYVAKKGSVIELDPCTLASEAEATAQLDGAAKVVPSSLHWCAWNHSGAEIWVWLRIGVDPAKSADPAKTSKVDINGISAIQELADSSGSKCEVTWSHLPLDGSFAEVVSVQYLRYGDKKAGEDTCAKAQAMAKIVAPKLPKP